MPDTDLDHRVSRLRQTCPRCGFTLPLTDFRAVSHQPRSDRARQKHRLLRASVCISCESVSDDPRPSTSVLRSVDAANRCHAARALLRMGLVGGNLRSHARVALTILDGAADWPHPHDIPRPRKG